MQPLAPHRQAVPAPVDCCWELEDSNLIEVFIGRLRKKLDPESEYKPIETLRGRGYRLAVARGTPDPA